MAGKKRNLRQIKTNVLYFFLENNVICYPARKKNIYKKIYFVGKVHK